MFEDQNTPGPSIQSYTMAFTLGYPDEAAIRELLQLQHDIVNQFHWTLEMAIYLDIYLSEAMGNCPDSGQGLCILHSKTLRDPFQFPEKEALVFYKFTERYRDCPQAGRVATQTDCGVLLEQLPTLGNIRRSFGGGSS